MKILLINNNPVVSRLTALSARKEDIEIDEIQEVTELNSDTYDIVFVDADSWSKDVRDVITENIKTQKSVLFYADGDEEDKASFDLSILKPFLPSEVSAVIRSIEEEAEELVSTSTEENHFNILDDNKEDNRNELFTLDGLDELEEKKDDNSLELESVDFDDKLEEAFPLKINTLEDDLFEDESKMDLNIEDEDILKKTEKNIEVKAVEEVEEKIKDNNELFELDLSDEVPSLEDDLFTEDKKEDTSDILNTSDSLDELKIDDEFSEVVNKVDDEFPLELDEPVLEEIKKETQILDELEIENIKGILTEDISDELTLEDLMPAMTSVSPIIEEKGKEVEEVNTPLNIDSTILAQTFSSMPVESLRELLAGATVNIKIKFPKSKK